MRLVLASAGRGVTGVALALALALAGVTGLAGCPTPQSPKGPPPLYEEPPAPSWLDSGGGGGEAGAD